MNQLADFLPYMQTDDVLASTEKAKDAARTLLEDQGTAALALLLADLLTETIRRNSLDIQLSSFLKQRVAA